jgi:hypothetical protein
MTMEENGKYWRYVYAYQNILERDVIQNEMLTGLHTPSGVRKESSMPTELIFLARDMAKLNIDGDVEISTYAYYKWKTLQLHPNILEIKNEVELQIQKTTKESFHILLDGLQDDLRAMIDDEVIADNYYVVHKNDSIQGGFATCADGYLTGLFSYYSGMGREIFELRLRQARKDANENVHEFKLLCTGKFLRKFYERFGFQVYHTFSWDDKLAPKGWNYDRFGRPDIYQMRRHINDTQYVGV